MMSTTTKESKSQPRIAMLRLLTVTVDDYVVCHIFC